MKTPITYYGGKQSLLDNILPLIPKHTIYTEPFFGGGAVFFAKEPSTQEIINDKNNMVINFYKTAKNNFSDLKNTVEQTLFSRTAYTVAHTIWKMPHLFTQLQQAWAFYVGTNMGFAGKIGSWGFDKYGKRTKAFLNKKFGFTDTLQKRLSTAVIENTDALKVIETYDTAETFHYLDPPYIDSVQGHYSGYDELEYEQLLDSISNIKGKFLLSSYPNSILLRYLHLHGWNYIEIDKPLNARKGEIGEKRKRKTELLVANYNI